MNDTDSPLNAPESSSPDDLHREIAELAHEYFRERSETPGFELDDWLRAEREVKAKYGLGE